MMVNGFIVGSLLAIIVGLIGIRMIVKETAEPLGSIIFVFGVIASFILVITTFTTPIPYEVRDNVPHSVTKTKDGVTTITWNGHLLADTSAKAYLVADSNFVFRVYKNENSWGIKLEDRFEMATK